MVKRGPTHATDTLAVRTILSELSEDWLVRNLEERDYGIDLTIEMFEKEEPTGKIALIQVKGRREAFPSFPKQVSLSFPVRTLEYALLFAEPFFVFHTSIVDKRTYFIWLQKYVTTELEFENPKWRAQDSVTVYFPKGNTLGENRKKIEEIMARYAARSEGLEYLAALDWLQEHWGSFSMGESDLLSPCLANLERMRKCKQFLAVYAQFDGLKPDFTEAKNCLETLEMEFRCSDAYGESTARLGEEFGEQLQKMSFLKKAFLDENDSDRVAAEISDPSY